MYQSPGESDDELTDDGNFDMSPRVIVNDKTKRHPGVVSFSKNGVEHIAKINVSNPSLVHDKYGVTSLFDWLEQITSKKFDRFPNL